MRADVREYSFGDYKFVLEFDSGGDPEIPYTLWITDTDDAPIASKPFAKNYNVYHVVNFCKKFANDINYRNSHIAKQNESYADAVRRYGNQVDDISDQKPSVPSTKKIQKK